MRHIAFSQPDSDLFGSDGWGMGGGDLLLWDVNLCPDAPEGSRVRERLGIPGDLWFKNGICRGPGLLSMQY